MRKTPGLTTGHTNPTSEPLNVLFVLPDLGGGGAERVVLTLLRHMNLHSFATKLFLLRDMGVHFDQIPSHTLLVRGAGRRGRLLVRLPEILWRLARHARQSDVIVGALELDATYLSYLAAALTRKPLIAWVHTAMEHHLSRMPRRHFRIVQHLYPKLQTVVFPSAGAAQSLRRITPLIERHIHVIPNPIDLEVLTAAAAGQSPQWADNVFRKPTVAAIGRLEFQKGFDLLIRAHADVRRSGLEHHLLILGEGSNRRDLETLVSQLDVWDSVFLPGYVNNPFPLLRRAHMVVASSRYEGFGMAIVEALGLGLPVIATDCVAGPSDILANGRYGLLVRSEDPASMAGAIKNVLLDEALRSRLAARAIPRARAFTPGAVVPQWEDLLTLKAGRFVPADLPQGSTAPELL